MTIEEPGEGDAVVDGGQRPLLIVDSAITNRLDGSVLDVDREEGAEPRFVLRGADPPGPQ
jgi:hypothetical protein